MKMLLTLAIFIGSSSAFALGRSDSSAIQPQLDLIVALGADCEHISQKDQASESFNKVDVVCKSLADGKMKKIGVITYEIMNPGSRCASQRALSFEIIQN